MGAINVAITPPSGGVYGATAFDNLYAWITSAEGQSHINDLIFVYCGSGTRSEAASNILFANCFSNVYDFPSYSTLVSNGFLTVSASINI